ncbi:hypothetical protein [Methylomonas albis]|uniref:PEP-CTERM protein-sorting domain-containing protein n=1 Tax=Methylomonas albis TaxID=1854563 RepID=A0ABR9D0B3_9GAMM|nr:hypothetical protein [Methylomonas albis]MBD9356568.1 hypothetical protein [Methylomonas albis]
MGPISALPKNAGALEFSFLNSNFVTLHSAIAIVSSLTLSLADPMVEADYFTVGHPGGDTFTTMGSVRIYDYGYCPFGIGPACNTDSVDLIGHINSLDLDNFANPAGGAFLNSSISSTLAPVPIPAAGILFGSGLFGFSIIRKRHAANRL